MFPKTKRTAMEEKLTMMSGGIRDKFPDETLLAKPMEKIEDREENVTFKKSIGVGSYVLIGLIAYLVFRK